MRAENTKIDEDEQKKEDTKKDNVPFDKADLAGILLKAIPTYG